MARQLVLTATPMVAEIDGAFCSSAADLSEQLGGYRRRCGEIRGGGGSERGGRSIGVRNGGGIVLLL
jgi:hypothetical protein